MGCWHGARSASPRPPKPPVTPRDRISRGAIAASMAARRANTAPAAPASGSVDPLQRLRADRHPRISPALVIEREKRRREIEIGEGAHWDRRQTGLGIDAVMLRGATFR